MSKLSVERTASRKLPPVGGLAPGEPAGIVCAALLLAVVVLAVRICASW